MNRRLQWTVGDLNHPQENLKNSGCYIDIILQGEKSLEEEGQEKVKTMAMLKKGFWHYLS